MLDHVLYDRINQADEIGKDHAVYRHQVFRAIADIKFKLGETEFSRANNAQRDRRHASRKAVIPIDETVFAEQENSIKVNYKAITTTTAQNGQALNYRHGAQLHHEFSEPIYKNMTLPYGQNGQSNEKPYAAQPVREFFDDPSYKPIRTPTAQNGQAFNYGHGAQLHHEFSEPTYKNMTLPYGQNGQSNEKPYAAQPDREYFDHPNFIPITPPNGQVVYPTQNQNRDKYSNKGIVQVDRDHTEAPLAQETVESVILPQHVPASPDKDTLSSSEDDDDVEADSEGEEGESSDEDEQSEFVDLGELKKKIKLEEDDGFGQLKMKDAFMDRGEKVYAYAMELDDGGSAASAASMHSAASNNSAASVFSAASGVSQMSQQSFQSIATNADMEEGGPDSQADQNFTGLVS